MPNFLLHPENRAFVAGRQARPRARIRWLALTFALIGAVLGGFVLAGALRTGDRRVLLGAIWMLLIFGGLALQYALGAWREWALTTQGEVIEGQVVGTHVERVTRRLYRWGRFSTRYVLTVRYRFVSPVSGAALTGTDSTHTPLPPEFVPPEGASVRVLYRDDRQHRLL
ncbi:MAG: hypothetical protein JW910_01885 [Anaerolineae bacterium]|nr:hypothetical protein [Anaerolineae bacterium]